MSYAGLKDVATAHGWVYGCAASSEDLMDTVLATAIAQECAILSSTVGGKMWKVVPQPGVWDFTDLDTVADFAQAAKQQLHVHTLVWARPEKNPDWLLGLSRPQRQEFMRTYIRTVLKRYPEAAFVDVVNEPLTFQDNLWQQAMGERYIDVAFSEARQSSNATLVLNEYGLGSDEDKQEAMLALLKRLKMRGAQIDALGMESHLITMPQAKPFRRFVRRVRELGLDVVVTEMDVRNSEDDIYVARVYRQYLRLLRRAGVHQVQTWGLRDSPSSSMRPLPLDRYLQIKPAYQAIDSVFQHSQ